MKRKLIALTAACALSLGTLAIVHAQDSTDNEANGRRHGEMGRHGRNPFDRLKDLNLTPDQQAKVQPIVDQAKPQIRAIHEDAMQKTKAIMTNAMAQIRPLLTPEQQQKLDAMHNQHGDMRNPHKGQDDGNDDL